ncbi:hypothetical protein [Chitinimonas naiadis]
MSDKRRIRARGDWQDELPVRHASPPEPVPRWCKHVAIMGILLFWGYYLGWLGDGGTNGLETGFTLFLSAQVPLLWRWLRGQMGRWR